MSESSETYSRWYSNLERAGAEARVMTIEQASLLGPSERYAIAQRARETARWLSYLAETMDLRQP